MISLLILVATFYIGAAQKIPNEWIIKIPHTVSEESRLEHLSAVRALGVEVTREFSFGDFKAYAIKTHGDDTEIITNLKGMDMVSLVEQNQIYKAIPVPPGKPQPTKPQSHKSRSMHNFLNMLRHRKWSDRNDRKRLQATCTLQNEATWGIERTSLRDLFINGEYRYHSNGEDVTAYVVDTGVYLEHEELEGRCTWGTDTADNPSTGTDENGHGTHVAGTIMSKMWGVAKKAKCIAVKVLGASGYGSTAGVIAGVEWTYQHYTATYGKRAGVKAVANMSLGGGYSEAMNSAVFEATKAGIAFVVAAGNESQRACLVSPASEESAITVACSDNTDTLCYFSNWGTCVDIIAPGMSITSAWIHAPLADNTISGTSMSSPHVAGVVAKLLSTGETFDTVAHVKEALEKRATDDMIDIQELIVRASTPNKLLFMECE